MSDSNDRIPSGPAAPPIPGFRLGYPQVSPSLAFGADEPTPVKMTEKYRPKTLCDVFGQGSAICQLQSFLDAPFPTAFLFDGPTGVGKTSTALALAAELGVDPNWSLIQIKSGEQDGDAVVSALKTLRFSAINGGWKMIIVDEADCISVKASNLWLSALEDLPSRSIIVFTTNHAEKFQDRFLDRCERITFAADAETLSLDALSLLRHVWLAETGRADHPALESLPNVVDRHGNVSFRRIVAALEPLIRQARSVPMPSPIVEPIAATPAPIFPDPAPVKARKPSRSAKSIIMDAIGAYQREYSRDHQDYAVAAVGQIYRETTPAQRSAISRTINEAGFSPDDYHDSTGLFLAFVGHCARGSEVSFPDTKPVPSGWDSIEAGFESEPMAPPEWMATPDWMTEPLMPICGGSDEAESTPTPDLFWCKTLGMIAYARGVVCAPAMHGEFIRRLAGRKIGDPRTLPEMEAWTAGWFEAYWASQEPTDPDPTPDPTTGPDFSATEVIGRIDSALEGRARLARVDVPRNDLMRSALDLRSDQIDREVKARFDAQEERNLAYHVMQAIERLTQTPARNDSPYWCWFDSMELCNDRPLFSRFADRMGFQPDMEDQFSRFVNFVNLCLKGSPIFPNNPPTPEGNDDGQARDNSYESAAPDVSPESTARTLSHDRAEVRSLDISRVGRSVVATPERVGRDGTPSRATTNPPMNGEDHDLQALDDDHRRSRVRDDAHALDGRTTRALLPRADRPADQPGPGERGPSLGRPQTLRRDGIATGGTARGPSIPPERSLTLDVRSAMALPEDAPRGNPDARPIDLSAFTVGWHGPVIATIAIDTDCPVSVLSPVFAKPPSCRFLKIKDRDYRVETSDDGIELTSPKGDVHYVIDGDCSCPSRHYRDGACKHLRALADAGLIPPLFPISESPSLSCDELDMARIFGMAF